jgi:phosphoglycerol transferase MdoB-like AlkP superfamily enzyme
VKKRILYIGFYAIFWIVFFWLSRLFFLIYNFNLTGKLHFADFFLIYYHGFALDLSITAYILMIPCILFIFSFWSKGSFTYYFLNFLTGILLFIFTFLVVADMDLYRYWFFRLDASPLLYLNTPGDIFASLSNIKIAFLVIVYLIFFCITYYLYLKYAGSILEKINSSKWYNSILFLIISLFLIIPVRGGIGIIPLNIGSVYFHKNIYANHAAVNVIWNIGNSLANYRKSEKLNFYSENEIEKVMNGLYFKKNGNRKILNCSKPNILLIILESFTGNIIQEISGKEGITPNMSKIAHGGIFFSNFYASGDRTDKALVAIISGYPALPANAIINYPDKTARLPFLSRELKVMGYKPAFFYGGDIDFANIKSYLTNGEIENIISKRDFDDSDYNSKWGVHDGILFNKVYESLNNSEQPFFDIIMTLSSHEPFDVPFRSKFNKNTETDKFYNSALYTDKCLGEFIEKGKKTKWWDNTLIIIMADHGKIINYETPVYAFEKYHIPMIWTGGAITKKDTVISEICSQTDILSTLISQLKTNGSLYMYSKDIFQNNPQSFAFYVFNNGYGFITDTSRQIYDNNSGKFIYEEGKINKNQINKGKAYFQFLINNF